MPPFHHLLLVLAIITLFEHYADNQTCVERPVLSKSKMCRCYHRPNLDDVDYGPPAPPGYILEKAEFDPLWEDDPYVENSVCLFFGHGPNAPDTLLTWEFLIQGINQHGWPTGDLEMVKYRDVCIPPGTVRRTYMSGVNFSDPYGCFEDRLGYLENLYTVGPDVPVSPGGNLIAATPSLYHFFNPIKEIDCGVLMLLRVNPIDPDKRPEKLRFVVEAYYSDTSNPALVNKTTTFFSPTFDVSYPAPMKVKLDPSTSDVELSLDYYLQVRNYSITNPTMCIIDPPPIPPIPELPEYVCACYIRPRQPTEVENPYDPQQPPYSHDRLDLANETTHFDNALDNTFVDVFDNPTLQFYQNLGATLGLSLEHVTLNGKHYVVVVYAYLPVYKERLWRQREVVMHAFAENGLPIGRWINPYTELEEYISVCEGPFSTLGFEWTMPPYPAVSDCVPYDPADHPGSPMFETGNVSCYFHFNYDYFFINCVGNCERPKYACGVWTYDKATDPQAVPFEFQFILNGVWYKNVPNSGSVVPIAPGIGPPPCPTAPPIRPPLREWFYMETHLHNRAYHRRSDLWFFTARTAQLFKRVDSSNQNSDIIPNLNHYEQEVVPNTELCVEPVTYFVEPKDNNICLCTFWRENLDTWQTHYGRLYSCVHASTNQFSEYFKIMFHPNSARDRIVVRVYVEDPQLLETYFIFHAVYIQAIDQFGLPVGKFDPGHWTANPSPPAPPDTPGVHCSNNIFPPSANPGGNTRYPIFAKRACPKRLEIPELGVENSTDFPELYVYQNRWRDTYPEVCANFYIIGNAIDHVKSVQFVAFIRIEDIKPGSRRRPSGHAYMIEIRSDIVDATDLTLPPTPLLPPPPQQDAENRMIPLNYNYYKSSLYPNSYNWERDCLDPVKEPPRLFQLCRHYITTPNAKEGNHKSCDELIDEYNLKCKLWVAAVERYTPNHPYATALKEDMDRIKDGVEQIKMIKDCFSLKAFRHRHMNALHVKFRSDGTGSQCDEYKMKKLKEVALMALNEEGYPIGRRWVRGEGSFRLYNYWGAYQNSKVELCEDDDIQLTIDDIIFETRMVYDDIKSKCFFQGQSVYKPDPTGFCQNFTTDDDVPSLFIWGNFQRDQEGFCAHWMFPDTDRVPPTYVQFVATVQIDHTRPGPVGTPQPSIVTEHFTIRSPKYFLEYNTQFFGGNLHECHEQEALIEDIGRPNDACKCELDDLINPPPTGLCVFTYAEYNNILDNRLYRTCVANEDPFKNEEDFDLTDCRTKIEYPSPPPVYPREVITLDPDGRAPPTRNFSLELQDPTLDVFEACGLIKQCYSRFHKDDIDKECIEGRSCDMLVTFGKGLGESPKSYETVIEIFAVARSWAAIGISTNPDDELMGEDYVVECVKEGGKVNLYNSWNIKSYQPNKPNQTNLRMRNEEGISKNIRPIKSVFYHDRLYCKFYIKIKFKKTDPDEGQERDFNLNKLRYYIMAFSNELADEYGEERGNIKTHVHNGAQSEIGRKKIAAGQRLSPLPHQTRYFRLHAMFMIFAWLFFMTLSTFIARYYKETLVKTRYLKQEFWYFFHIVTALLAFVCLIISLIFQTEGIRGWRNLFRSNFHTYSGILSVCLFAIVLVLGLWARKRPEGDTLLMNLIHSTLGHLVYNFALINMALSERVAYGFMSCNFKIYIWIWLVVYYLLHCFMSYHYCWVDFILGRKIGKRKYDPISLATQHFHNDTRVGDAHTNRHSLRKSRRIMDLESLRRNKAEEKGEIEAPGRYIRICALVIFGIVTTVYAFWAIRKVVTYPKHCYNFKELKHLEENGFN